MDKGKIVAASGHLFRIIDGRRVWISDPPAEYFRDAEREAQLNAKREATHV